jgi:hypothetical protein
VSEFIRRSLCKVTLTRVVSTLRWLILNVWWSKIHCYSGQIRPWTDVAVNEDWVTLFGLGLALLCRAFDSFRV